MQEGQLQPHLRACKPPCCCCLFLLAPTPTTTIACTHRHASKVMFFFFFFHFFSDHWRDLFSHMPGPQTPTSPPCLAPQALQVLPPPLPHLQAHKESYVFFLLFHFFSDQCCRDLFSPHTRSSNPHLSTVHHPSSLISPTTTIASFAGMQVKICFFCFFFLFLF